MYIAHSPELKKLTFERTAMTDGALIFGKYKVDLSNTDKIIFPDEGITKGDLIEYYRKIANVMLPHVEDRPLTLHRFPDGINGEGFYQKEASDYFPEWIEKLPVKKKEDGETHYVICNNEATLVYLANQASITPHVWLSRKNRLEKPDRLIFDLDPPEGNDFSAVRRAAITLRKFLDNEVGLTSFVMTTGSRGLHLAVPIKASQDFDAVRSFAQKVAKIVAQRNPDSLTTEIRKEKRKGRIFLDTARNAYAQTAVAPYSVRPKPGAPVATPLDWDELSEDHLNAQSYRIRNIFRRLAQKPDPWKQINRHRVSLPKAVDILNSIR